MKSEVSLAFKKIFKNTAHYRIDIGLPPPLNTVNLMKDLLGADYLKTIIIIINTFCFRSCIKNYNERWSQTIRKNKKFTFANSTWVQETQKILILRKINLIVQ